MNVLYNGIITDSTVLPWYLRIQWSFYYLSTTSAITVTLLFILIIEEGKNNVCLNHLPLLYTCPYVSVPYHKKL